MSGDLNIKFERLKKILIEMESVLIAYSGGTDSTFLAKIAFDELGDNIITVTIDSLIHPKSEKDKARRIIRQLGIRNMLIKERELIKKESFVTNPRNRCYICKREMFFQLKKIAKENSISFIADGSNRDDLNEYRPGLKALRELKIRSPLIEADLSKKDIRFLSKNIGLPTWDKSSNTCLVTRIPYGERITINLLKKIDDAENYIRNVGFAQVRARYYKELVRIEVNENDIGEIAKKAYREKIVKYLKGIGFKYVTVDLQGYRTGSMDIK